MHDADRTPEQRLTEEAALREQLAARDAEIAACKQALAQLQESEARYRDLFENASDIMYTLDLEGTITSLNKAGEQLGRLLGYPSPSDAIRTENLHGEQGVIAADFQRHSRQMLAKKDAGTAWTTYELELMTQDGQRLPLEVSTRLIYANGQPTGVQGIARDITARKQVEARLQQAYLELEHRVQERTTDVRQLNAKLQESEARYRELFENASDFIYTLDLEGNFTSLNKAFERLLRLLGYTYDATRTLNTRDILAPGFKDYSRQMQAKKVAGTAWTTYEVELTTQDGQHLPLEVSTRLIYTNGQPTGSQGIARDITARKQVEARLQQAYLELEHQVQERTAALRQLNAKLQADITERKQVEETLRASEALNRSIVEAMPGGIIQVSQDGHVVRANAEAQHILGLRYDHRINHFAEHMAPQFVWEDGTPCEEKEDPIAQCLATHKPQPATTMGIRHADGTVTWAVFTAIPLRAPATGEFTGALMTFLDITERKQAEEDRKHLEAQLQQSHKMEAIGTMAGGIAHDFNNILGAILNFTELTQYEVPPESRAAANLREVLQASRRAKDLVQQILTFSHQSEMQRQPVQLALLVKETLALLRASLPTTIDMQQHIAEDSGTVLADPTQMHQILMNICTNAEYAMRETGGMLDIRVNDLDLDANMASTHPQLRPGPYIRLTIQDTGRGMTPDMLGRIFDPFFTTKSVGEGTGMGLAVVHGIVAQHGGVITVESAPGAGSTFTIYLPRMRETAAKRTQPTEDVTPQGTGCILFVDDEVTITDSMSILLESLGYAVIGHTSGPEALATFQAEPHRFDLVITDQTMPHMTGEILAQELRQLRPDIPIILCTGFSHVMNAEKALTQGIDAFCMKPLTVRDLAVTIRQVLARRAGCDAEQNMKE